VQLQLDLDYLKLPEISTIIMRNRVIGRTCKNSGCFRIIKIIITIAMLGVVIALILRKGQRQHLEELGKKGKKILEM